MNTGQTIVSYADGELVFRQGDPGDCMYLVLEGAVRIFREVEGIETTLGELGVDQIFGELALFDQLPRSASARAVGETRLRRISQEEFMGLDCDLLIRKMLVALGERLRTVNQAFERASLGEGPEWERLVNAMRDREWLE